MSERINHLCVRNFFIGYQEGKFVSKNINFEVSAGEIMAIMGPSGAGKSTLLEGVLGRAPVRRGQVSVNGEDFTANGLSELSAHVGRVPQQDVLYRELTVRQNIEYFHQIAIDSEHSKTETAALITQHLADLGIDHVAESSVADISGGQLKRANIAMELINDPDILIIDEPTSGLSSQDSLALVENLRTIANRGKIVIIIIHQPSSEIFQLFDRLLMLDGKGHCIRSGPAMEVLRWFSTVPGFPGRAECPTCNNVFPDKLLATVEKLESWQVQSEAFAHQFNPQGPKEKIAVPRPSFLPSPFAFAADLWALFSRQLLVRCKDRMGMTISVLAPPLLSILLSLVFKSTPDGADYRLETNALYPQALFMLIIGSIFLGLVGSVFEIIKDRAMYQRELQRGLPPATYYVSELLAASFVGVLQVFVMVTMTLWLFEALDYWSPTFWVILLVQLSSIALGLLLSTLFESAISAYNMIPLVMIPQIILGGALLPYKDMGGEVYLWETRDISQRPIPGAVMPASWAYQMLMRLHFEQMKEDHSAKNVVIREQEFLKRGNFLAPSSARVLRTDLREKLPEKWALDSAYVDDLLVMLLIASGLIGSGLIWIRLDPDFRKRSFGGKPGLWVSWLLLLTALTMAYFYLTEKNTTAEGRQINYLRATTTLAWSDAKAFCSARKGELAGVADTLLIFDRDLRLSAGSYWTNETEPAQKGVMVSFLKLGRTSSKSNYSQQSVDGLKKSGVLALTQRAQQKLNFICIMNSAK